MKLLLLSLISSYLLSFIIMSNAESGEVRVIPNGVPKPNGNGGSGSCPNSAGSQCGGQGFTGDTCCPDGYVCRGTEWWKSCQTESSSHPTAPDYCPNDDNFCKNKDDGNYEIAPNKNWYVACVAGIAYCMPCAPVHPGEPELVYNESKDKCLWPAGHPAEEYNNIGSSGSSGSSSTNGNGNGNGDDGDDGNGAAGPPPSIEETDNCPDGFCADKSIGNFANPDTHSPHFFIQCSPAGQFCTECPANLVYDASTNRCEYSLSGLRSAPAPALIRKSDNSHESKNGIRR